MKLLSLTVFDEAEYCAVLKTHIHVEVLHIDVHVPHPVLIVLTFSLEVLDHGPELLNLGRIFADASRIPSQTSHTSYIFADAPLITVTYA